MLNVFIDFTFKKRYLFIVLHLNFSSHNLFILLIIFDRKIWEILSQSIGVVIQFQILRTLRNRFAGVFRVEGLFVLFVNEIHGLLQLNLFVQEYFQHWIRHEVFEFG